MKMTNDEYKKYAESHAPRTRVSKNLVCAFLIGGAICCFGQFLLNLFSGLGLDEKNSGTATTICLIFIAALLTGLGLYDDIAKHAGAGTLVPVTGFSNSVVSPALEFKSETITLGTCTKMFTIAGPVIVFGVVSSVIYGIIYWIVSLF